MAKKKGSLNFVEQHLEKGLLGLAVLFVTGVGVHYLGMEPNKVEYGGEKLAPLELEEAILRQAEDLQRAVKNARGTETRVAPYAQKLQQSFDAGLFGDPEEGGPPLVSVLPVAAQFGPALPEFEGQEEPEDVLLVNPLKPTSLAVRTGISLAYCQQATLGEAVPPTENEGPTELSWVTVGAYFPAEAQQREMIKAGYAGYRAKVYLVGIDAQRQEMTASGDFGQWEDVEASKAMPRVDPPAPVFDDKTGDLVNQAELDEFLHLIRRSQWALTQPLFYPVEAGDDWEMPPLAGHEPEEEEREEKVEKAEKVEREPTPSAGQPRGGGRAAPRRSSGRGRMGGGRMGPRTGGGPPGGAPSQADDPKKQIREDLKEAGRLLKKKEYDQAEQVAKQVADNVDASKGQRAQARKILKQVQRRRERLEARQRGIPTQQGPGKFIRNPEAEGEIGIWIHDDAVEPGKTYRYRMRGRLWNRYVGRRASLRDTAQADLSVLEGEWSLPSVPITVAPKQHFFVRGPSFGEPAARVEVFTWYKGNWLMEDFSVRVGDVIGGVREVKTGEYDDDDKPKREKVDFSTDAIVLDLRIDEPVLLRRSAGKEGQFAYRDSRSLVLVYLDPADGQVKERIDDVDRNDPLHEKLKEEWNDLKDTL